MVYTVERIRELAVMARVSLDDAEAERLCVELNAMRAIADALRDASDLPDPFHGAVGLNAMREDTVCASLSRDGVLALSPCVERDATAVPRAVEE